LGKVENKVIQRKSVLSVLLSPAIWMLGFLDYIFHKYNLDKLIKINIIGWNFGFFIVGVTAGIFTERFFSWGGRPLIKIEERKGVENYRSKIRKGLIKACSICLVGLLVIWIILWFILPFIPLGRETYEWKLFFSCYGTGVFVGLFIPYFFKLFTFSHRGGERVDKAEEK
jgi:hypothetical protein